MTNPVQAISLFSGAGGMDVGFENAGVQILFANEMNRDAADTYRANRQNSRMANGDIHDIMGRISDYAGVDLVFGGPPCQGFSVAGKMNPDDDRSKLIFTFLEVVEKTHPRAFVMENVKALGKLGKWDGIRKRFLARAAELGYSCHIFFLNAADFGVPQKRERVFFVGVQGDTFNANDFYRLIARKSAKAPSIKETLRPLGKAGTKDNPLTCTAKINFCAHPVMRVSPYAGMYFNGQGRPIDINGYANTLPASMGGNKTPFIDEAYLYGEADDNFVEDYHRGLADGTISPEYREAPKRLRRITIKEAAKIQTFPDDYTFCGKTTSVYKQIGNAVPCKMAEAIASAVVEYMQ